MAKRLGDSRSKAYSLAGEIHVSTIVAPKSLDEFRDTQKRSNQGRLRDRRCLHSELDQICCRLGRVSSRTQNEAREVAHELMQVAAALTDPRSTGLVWHS